MCGNQRQSKHTLGSIRHQLPAEWTTSSTAASGRSPTETAAEVHSRRRLSGETDDVTDPCITPPAWRHPQTVASRTDFPSARPPVRLTSRARPHSALRHAANKSGSPAKRTRLSRSITRTIGEDQARPPFIPIDQCCSALQSNPSSDPFVTTRRHS